MSVGGTPAARARRSRRRCAGYARYSAPDPARLPVHQRLDHPRDVAPRDRLAARDAKERRLRLDPGAPRRPGRAAASPAARAPGPA
eukprot:226788-Prymnesium_polylepis.1